MTLGSLFDGIGVFPLAASHHGIVPVWASEIEKIPISITKGHFPNMKHLGDITILSGRNIPPVDIITFGSPCQNLSTMGAREGLSGNKSSLFHHAIRIIREMRCATNGKFPAIAVWENVMGAFSSNHRLDFKAVLEAFTSSPVPIPESGKWSGAGMVRGTGTSLCWRVMDAQYWGIPTLKQRRRRIFLVADFREERAKEILFKPRPMQPHPVTCREGKDFTAGDNRISFNETGRSVPVLYPFQPRRMRQGAKDRNGKIFKASFGKSTNPFPTLLAGEVSIFAFWLKGAERDGYIRYVTPVEAERLMGLPDNWTAYGNTGLLNSDNTRYRGLGNAIALPCAEYIMAGIAEVFQKEG